MPTQMTTLNSCDARHVIGSRAAVDDTAWDGGAAMSNCAGKDDPAPCYGAICAGKKAGDEALQSSWALPHHKTPGDPPNAAAVRNGLARLPQTKDLTNRQAAEDHLQAHLKAIQGDSSASASMRALPPKGWDPDGDGDDDSSAATDTDNSHWNEDGTPNVSLFLLAGMDVPDPDNPDAAGGLNTGAVLETDDETDSVPGSVSGGPGSAGGVSTINSKAPRENLVRAMPSGFEVRAADPSLGPTDFFMTFSKFNQWYPVSSVWEGEFMERVLPGAFADTIKNDRAQMRVLYDHGFDPSIGNKPIGPIRTYEEREDGPYVDGPFLDTSYNRDEVIPMLTGRLLDGSTVGSQLGASFRFQVMDDSWNMKPKPSKWNPNGLPQRSIIRTKTFEAGPVTFPASPSAEAAARSLSDEWLARLIGDNRFQQDFADRVGGKVAERVLGSIPLEMRQEIVHQSAASRHAVLRRKAQALLVLSA